MQLPTEESLTASGVESAKDPDPLNFEGQPNTAVDQDHPYFQFFRRKNWFAFPWQQDVLAAYNAGHSGLLNAPTGSGKTYGLFIPILSDWLDRNGGQPANKNTGLVALWITPVRALGGDISRAMAHASDIMDANWSIALRTGDTSAKDRAAQKRNTPQVIVTTPESLHLMLATKGYADLFRTLEVIVFDEWHELLGSKRGVQSELALSRLRALNPKLRTWAISATIGNLEQGLEVLMGSRAGHEQVSILKADIDKKIVIESILPDEVEEFPWGGHLGTKLVEKVVPILQGSGSTLVFTNTRAQCEIWYQKLLEADPMLAGVIALHHGSLSADIRQWVEAALHAGKLKAVVCTSSLDLGVDFKAVETIVQIGGPKGVARFLQRAGRSGHQPGALSRIYFLPAHSLELMEAAALRTAIAEGKVEDKVPIVRAFDVLAQYLVTLGVSDGFDPELLLIEIRSTHAYASITDQEWTQVMHFVSFGGQSLQAYGEFARLVKDETGSMYRVTNRRIAMRHRISMGTITSDAMITVKFVTGGFIGSVEEYFISRLNPGDVFMFGGRALEFVRMHDMKATVRLAAKNKKAQTPSWQGGRMPLSSQLSHMIRRKLTLAMDPDALGPEDMELQVLQPLFRMQAELSVLPREDEFLIEEIVTRDGYHLFFYTFEGRLVNEGMANLIAHRIGRTRSITFSISMTDYGFELLSDTPLHAADLLEEDLLTTNKLVADIMAGVNVAELSQRKFRDIARIAGLTFEGFPGKTLKTRQLQASSRIFFKVFTEYEPDNLLLKQAYEEVLYDQLEENRLRAALNRIAGQKIIIMKPQRFTPFCFPIMVEMIRGKLTTETIEDRVAKMLKQAVAP